MRDSKTGEEENILSREWQQTRFKKYVLPDAVYYQSLWAVRDLERMEERIKELSDTRDAMEISGSLVKDGGADYPEGRRKNSGKTFPNKVWRIWKQRFLYDVAVNLAIL